MRVILLRVLASASFALVVGHGSLALAQAVSFQRLDISTGLTLTGPVVADDFNGDAILDLLVSNRLPQESSGLHLLLGQGDGSFAAPLNIFPFFSSPVFGAADVTRDGLIDVLLLLGGELWVLRGDGTGTFQQLVRSAGIAPSPRRPVIADVNHDGTPDVVVASQFGGIAVSLGNGDGSFQPSTHFPISGGFSATELAAGDFNGDGHLDVAATNPGAPDLFQGSTVSILLGHGDGTFGPPTDFQVGTTPLSIVTTDFNHDGHLDLAVTALASPVSVLLGRGDGTFRPRTEYSVGPSETIAAYDVTGDAHDDLLVCGPPAVLSVLPGDGAGGFGARQDFADATDCVSIAGGDFNRDGRVDLAINYFAGSGTISIFLNTTEGAPDTTPPTVTARANPPVLWPPNGKTIAVVVTGTMTDAGTGLDPSTGRFRVIDEYGLVDAAGPVAIAADGTYSVKVPLVASRRGADRDGRQYSIVVSATDRAGNAGSATTTVTVPHSR